MNKIINLSFVFFFCFLGLVLPICFGADINCDNRNATTCDKPFCIGIAEMLHNAMDNEAKIDACNDFYGFVCSKWIKNNQKTPNQSVYFGALNEAAEKINRDLLDDQHTDPILKSISNFYKSCRSHNKRHEVAYSPISLFIAESIGAFPLIDNSADFKWSAESNRSLENALRSLRNAHNADYLVKVHGAKGLQHVSNGSLLIDTLGGGDKDLLLKQLKLVLAEYAGSTKQKLDDKSLDSELKSIIQLEESLADFGFGEDDFERRITSIDELTTLYPSIDWKSLFDTQSPEYIRINRYHMASLVDLLKNTKPSTLANYLAIRLLLDYAPYTTEEMDKLMSPLIEISDNRNKPCTELVHKYAKGALLRMYFDKNLNPNFERQMANSLEVLKQAFEGTIVEGNVLNGSDLDSFASQLHDIRFKFENSWIKSDENYALLFNELKPIAEDDTFLSGLAQLKAHQYKLENSNFVETIPKELLNPPAEQTLEPTFDRVANSIEIPVETLNYPFAMEDAPVAFTLGGLGSLITKTLAREFFEPEYDIDFEKSTIEHGPTIEDNPFRFKVLRKALSIYEAKFGSCSVQGLPEPMNDYSPAQLLAISAVHNLCSSEDLNLNAQLVSSAVKESGLLALFNCPKGL